ncbi:MAG: glucose-6-phosphate dehydrogenase [Candidatus Binataceae bacterium]|nr:glucose-6-phosphate dehydrogenase [Candidatus Binataceae bacterium]
MNSSISIAQAQTPSQCTVVIFGASGDLARRKLIPALYNLRACGQDVAPPKFAVLGFARRPMAVEEFRATARTAAAKFSRLELEENCWQEFATGLDYLPGLDQPEGFRRLKARIEETEAAQGLPANRIYYLSVPPEAVPECVERLDSAGLIAKPGAANFTRVVVEKPIGTDLASARKVQAILQRYFDESQIFRIDHYLGKETVQDLMVLRFANTIFERMWGARNVDHVQITVAESEGVGSRAMYYDPAGALRDMVQNHMLQLLALIAMEAPVALDAAAIRESKLNVLRALRPIPPSQARNLAVRARYGAGTLDGEKLRGYLQEQSIPATSQTETFVALKTYIDNWRWSGVPFYLRTGKRMPARASIIYVQFKDVPKILFNREQSLPPNALTIRIQPDEGFSFEVLAKRPGLDIALRPVRMNLRYDSEFSGPSPDAYERLLLDVMSGDHTLFVSAQFVEKSWEFVESVLDQWRDNRAVPMHEYAAGTYGPAAAEQLIRADGRTWMNP